MLGRVKSAKPEEEITVTAGTETKEVLPSSGKTIKKATVNPTPSQSKSVTPSASQKIVAPDTGKLLNKVTVAGDSDLVAGNIKKDVNIFGVVGSLESKGLLIDATNSTGDITEARIIMDRVPGSIFRQSPGDYRIFPALQKLLIQANEIGSDAFYYALKKPKVKIKSEKLGVTCFINTSGAAKFWLSNDVETIQGSSYTYTPFYNSNNVSLYCEAEAKKEGWSSYWNYSGRNSVQPTMWGVSESEFDTL